MRNTVVIRTTGKYSGYLPRSPLHVGENLGSEQSGRRGASPRTIAAIARAGAARPTFPLGSCLGWSSSLVSLSKQPETPVAAMAVPSRLLPRFYGSTGDPHARCRPSAGESLRTVRGRPPHESLRHLAALYCSRNPFI